MNIFDDFDQYLMILFTILRLMLLKTLRQPDG